MEERQKINATARADSGKIVAKRLRDSGQVPGVLYGHGRETVNVVVKTDDLGPALAGGAYLTHIYDIIVKDDKKTAKPVPVMIKEVQRNPISGQLLNVDFHAISLTEKIIAHVPVVLRGEAIGVKHGGILERLHTEIEVSCLPTKIPDHLEWDITEMEIGDSVHARDLVLPEDVVLATSPDEVVALLAPPAKPLEEEEPEAAAEEEMAEPEVIAQKGEQAAEGEEAEAPRESKESK